MGVNMFYIAVKSDVDTKDHINILADEANEHLNVTIGEGAWCDPFAGKGGCILSIKEALGFSDEDGPWYVQIQHDDSLANEGDETFFEFEPSLTKTSKPNPAWRDLLTPYKDRDDVIALFLKVRL